MAGGFLDLSNQVAVVTGGARGIGEAIVRRLAQAGASVAVADLDGESAERTAHAVAAETGVESFAVPVDVSDSASVEGAFDVILRRTGRIDVLVNDAGTAGKTAPVWEQSDQDWRRTFAVNTDGVFYCSRAVIQHMRKRGYGRIVNIASIAGKEGNPNMSAYCAAKAAVIAFTKSLAKEVIRENICVNVLAPGTTRTRILDQMTPEQVEYLTSRIPMGRLGRPEEIAAVAHFLASPDCSFVTGQCYDASGGRATY